MTIFFVSLIFEAVLVVLIINNIVKVFLLLTILWLNILVPVIETVKHSPMYRLCSLMFSPKDSTHLAIADSTGARVIDFRADPNEYLLIYIIKVNRFILQVAFTFLCRYLLSFQSPNGYHSAQYNGKGTRLLCDAHTDQLTIYDIPQTMEELKTKREVRLTNHGNSAPFTALQFYLMGKSCCFAGKDDELVAGSMRSGAVCIWSVPDGSGEQEINQPLLAFEGNRFKTSTSVRYGRQNCLLATSGSGNIIKLWSPFKLPGSVGAVNFELSEEEEDI